eukprot:1484094-Rhodomonas_salina.1
MSPFWCGPRAVVARAVKRNRSALRSRVSSSSSLLYLRRCRPDSSSKLSTIPSWYCSSDLRHTLMRRPTASAPTFFVFSTTSALYRHREPPRAMRSRHD